MNKTKLLILLLFALMFVNRESSATEPCSVVVGFNWIPPDQIGTAFENPTVKCSAKLADSAKNRFAVLPILLTSNQTEPLAMNEILMKISRDYPGCKIIGLGYFDLSYRKAPFTDPNGKPILPIEMGSDGHFKYVPFFPPSATVRAEVTGLNEIDSVGGKELPFPIQVDPLGKRIESDPHWIHALQRCVSTNDRVTLGFDRDPGADACNQESYLLAQKKMGGFFHISDCRAETLVDLIKLIDCLDGLERS